MDEGPGTEPGSLGWFVGVWLVTMAAMMFPSVAPTVALYSRTTRERSRPVLPVFTSRYLRTRAATGIVAFGITDAAAQPCQQGSRHEHCRPSTE